MIKERIKSFLLLVLVSLSFLLTYQLWYGQKPTHLIAEEIYERGIAEPPRPLVEAITPSKIVVTSDDGYYLHKEGNLGFHLLWGAVSQLLQEYGKDNVAVISTVLESGNNLLTFYMQPDLPIGLELPWLTGLPYMQISKIDLLSDGESTWLVLSDSENISKLDLLIPPENAEELMNLIEALNDDILLYKRITTEDLAELAEENLIIEKSIYVPIEPIYISALIVKPEILDRDLLIKTFFVDYSLARIIEEKDGGLIYTDGEQGLRLTDIGLEYSYPRMESGLSTISYPEALKSSSSLISYHGGWPANLRLEQINLIRRGRSVSYEAKWRVYYKGYPVNTKKSSRAIFNDRGLIHYTRTFFFAEGAIADSDELLPAAGWRDALKAVLDIIMIEKPGITAELKLERIEIGYAIIKSDNGFRAEPCWLIQVNGVKYFLQAHNLEWFDEEDIL